MRSGHRGRRLVTLLLAALATLVVLPMPVGAASTAMTGPEMAARILGRINEDRVERGLVRYRALSPLVAVAQERADRLATATRLSHTVAGGDIGPALDSRSVTWYGWGENIGMSGFPWGAESADHLYRMWMDSAPHRAGILSDDYNYIGIGLARAADGSTWASMVLAETRDYSLPVAKNGKLTRSGTTVTYRWGGSDVLLQTHTAGLRSFDVQYRVDSGAWKTIRDNTTTTSVAVKNRPRGHWYGFRVQSADRRGNLSRWTSEVRIWVP